MPWIQKFPFIVDGIADLSNRRFAVIIDEVMAKQRKKERDLYKLYAKDEAFYQAFFDTMKRLTENPQLVKYD
ncbi:MAG: hypothetical protein PHD82_13330 [Candidatus Riflebacteria bacterium]|nr:hypothetical protein [Candidatus Riflebacteria bacterium]